MLAAWSNEIGTYQLWSGCFGILQQLSCKCLQRYSGTCGCLKCDCVRLAGKEIEKATQGIYPLQNTAIRKVKILRAPKFDLTKLLEVHGDYSEEAGAKVGSPPRSKHLGAHRQCEGV